MEFEPSAWGDTPFFSPSDIILVKQISEGSFGTVYKALYMYQTVAVKVFRQQRDVGILDSHPSGSGTTSLINQMEQEVRILRNLRHKNVVGFLGAVMDPPAIVMDYCEWDALLLAYSSKLGLFQDVLWVSTAEQFAKLVTELWYTRNLLH